MDKAFLQDRINRDLIKLILSNPRKKTEEYNKTVIKPFEKEGILYFQFERFTATQAFHSNHTTQETVSLLMDLLEEKVYKQMDGYTSGEEWHALFNKKGKANITVKSNDKVMKADLSHNRQKKYLLEEGKTVPYLVHLGVMTEDGRVTKKRYDKFRQINRFLEMVDDVIPSLPIDRTLKIIDFGCGRSYLTFALYHYLSEVKGLPVHIEGLDLKEKVIEDCNRLARDCHYENLSFKHGDIVDYTSDDTIDMVVTLHACDTATDLALQKAVGWKASAILSVPCCQHELNSQIDCEPLADLLQYGIIKERVSALFTDAMRANWLKLQGYEVQMLEFIDVAHTPKNLLIRGVKVNQKEPATQADSDSIDYSAFDALQNYLGSDLTIRK